jgi:hypothetical protein
VRLGEAALDGSPYRMPVLSSWLSQKKSRGSFMKQCITCNISRSIFCCGLKAIRRILFMISPISETTILLVKPLHDPIFAPRYLDIVHGSIAGISFPAIARTAAYHVSLCVFVWDDVHFGVEMIIPNLFKY